MKKSKKKTKGNGDLETISTKTIISIGILMIFIILTGIMIINIISNSGSNEMYNQSHYWTDAYKKIADSKVGIQFNDISTTDNQYLALRVECNEQIEKTKVNPDTKVSAGTTVNEQTFIDKSSNENVTFNKTNNSMIETGPLYFENTLMMRYINDNGEIKMLTALFQDENKEKTQVLDQSELGNYMNAGVKQQKEESSKQEVNPNIITEEQYLAGLESTVIHMLKATTPDEINAAQTMAIKYFTIEGSESVFDGKRTININNSSNISVNYIAAGKSDTSLGTKDRIYMQIKIRNNTETGLASIILKLNNNYRIFDIDLI